MPTAISSENTEDAHPGRSVLLRKILFYAGRSRFSELENRAWQSRRLRLLGPVVSGSGTLNRVAWRRNSFLSNRHRVAPTREEKIWRCSIFRLADDAAQPRHREWVFCGSGKSCRP